VYVYIFKKIKQKKVVYKKESKEIFENLWTPDYDGRFDY